MAEEQGATPRRCRTIVNGRTNNFDRIQLNDEAVGPKRTVVRKNFSEIQLPPESTT
jgi:hypothetical protein